MPQKPELTAAEKRVAMDHRNRLRSAAYRAGIGEFAGRRPLHKLGPMPKLQLLDSDFDGVGFDPSEIGARRPVRLMDELE